MRRVMRWLQLHIEPHAAGKRWLHKTKQQVKRVEFFPSRYGTLHVHLVTEVKISTR